MKVRWDFNLESQGDLCPNRQMAPRYPSGIVLHSLDISIYTQYIFPFFNNNCISHALLLLLCSVLKISKILVSKAECETVPSIPCVVFPSVQFSACYFKPTHVPLHFSDIPVPKLSICFSFPAQHFTVHYFILQNYLV